MNTLSYGLLSLLSLSPFTGYDLTQRIQPFWPAKHSQIYPLLAQLEKEGMVEHESVAQSDKPDKKIYTLTANGKETLRKWIVEPSAEPVQRDEFTLKAFCLSEANPVEARRLLKDRAEQYRFKILLMEEKLRAVRERAGLGEGEIPDFHSSLFGSYILIQKALNANRANLEWCDWALTLVP
jgi:PadR family transcriptional regulator, multidrug transcriptional repressor LadR